MKNELIDILGKLNDSILLVSEQFMCLNDRFTIIAKRLEEDKPPTGECDHDCSGGYYSTCPKCGELVR